MLAAQARAVHVARASSSQGLADMIMLHQYKHGKQSLGYMSTLVSLSDLQQTMTGAESWLESSYDKL